MNTKNYGFVLSLLFLFVFGLVVLPVGLIMLTWDSGDVTKQILGCIIAGIIWGATGAAIGSAWTRHSLITGGKLIMEATDHNDQWDVRKMEAVGRVFSQGVSMARSHTPQLMAPIEGDWDEIDLPQITPFGS